MGRNKHIKKCNECEFTAPSLRKLKNHKKIQHAPDDFYEEQAFDKLLYNKIWRLRVVQDPLEGLKVYKSKIGPDVQNKFTLILLNKNPKIHESIILIGVNLTILASSIMHQSPRP